MACLTSELEVCGEIHQVTRSGPVYNESTTAQGICNESQSALLGSYKNEKKLLAATYHVDTAAQLLG